MSQNASIKVVSGETAASTKFARLDNKGSDGATCYAGAPTYPTSDTWGADQVGALLLDTSTDGAGQAFLHQWEQLTAGPTYGLRRLRLVKKLRPADVVAIVALTSRSTDLAYGSAVSLASTLDSSVQDSGQVAFLVKSVLLRVRVRFTAGSHPGGDKLYVALKNADGTQERKIYCPPVVNCWAEHEVVLHLNSAEEYKIAVDTDGGNCTVAYQIDLIEAEEAV